ncbi:MAG: transketolase family protein [Bacillota bacterium]
MAGKATREAYGEALVELGAVYEELVVLDADLSKSTMTAKFQKVYPERFFNVGIAEQNLMGIAAGMAAAGKIPFASTFAIFATGRAWEQVRNTIAYPGHNVKIAASHAGITVGPDGASHQALEDIALMRVIPGMTVLVPADARETREVVEAAIKHKGPVYIRLGRPAVPDIYGEKYRFKIGEASLLCDGDDVAIVAAGYMVHAALSARDILAGEGVAARVINMCSVKPLDNSVLLEAASTCKAVVTAEEHSIIGGLGSAVAEFLAERHPVPVRRVGVRDLFGQSGEPGELLQAYGLTAEDIVREALEAIRSK